MTAYRYLPYNTYVKYVEESSYGGGGTEALAIGVITNFSPTLKNNLVPIRGIGEGRDAIGAVYGNFDATGTIDLQVTPETLTFMQFLIGVRSGGGTTGNPYILTENDRIGTGASDIGTISMEVGSEAGTLDDVDVYDGVHLLSGTLTATQGALLTGSFNWVAQSVTSSESAGSYTAAAFTPYTFQQGTFKWGDAPTTIIYIQSFTLNMNNNSHIFRSLGSREIEQPETGQRTYDFTIVAKMARSSTDHQSASDILDDFYGQDDSPISGIANPTADLEIEMSFVSSDDYKLFVYLDDCHIEEVSKPVPVGNDLVEVTFTGWAETGKTNAPFKYWTGA